MSLYRVAFAADHNEPIPLPLESLPAVEADDPITAVEMLLRSGRVPQDRLLKWARVINDGVKPGQRFSAVRVPITPEGTIPMDWGR